MSHEWHRGVLSASSWHGLEEVGVMSTADDAIAHGERSGAWPVALRLDDIVTVGGIKAPGHAVVATYAAHPEAALSVVGDRYRATTPDEWRTLVKAACAAGAKPTGTFSLRDGSRVLATFEVGESNGLRTQLLLADSFDGTLRLTCGTSSVRVVCANTLSAAIKSDGKDMAMLRHTASLEQKVNILAENIGAAIEAGDAMRKVYHEAESMRLTRPQADRVFDLLFPPAEEKADKAAKTRAANVRLEAEVAMVAPVNNAGPTLATIWNAATYLVDRHADGTARPVRGGDALDSMLFGARADRVQEIHEVIEVIMKDGSIQRMTPARAMDHCDPGSVARTMLNDILNEMSPPA